MTHGTPLDVRVMDRDRLGHDDVCGQGKYYLGHLLHDDLAPMWTHVTIHLEPHSVVKCDLLFTATAWATRRICGMPLLHAVRGQLSPVPMIVSVLVSEIESRGTGGEFAHTKGGWKDVRTRTRKKGEGLTCTASASAAGTVLRRHLE